MSSLQSLPEGKRLQVEFPGAHVEVVREEKLLAVQVPGEEEPNAMVRTEGRSGMFDGATVDTTGAYDEEHPFESVVSRPEEWHANLAAEHGQVEYWYTPFMLVGDSPATGTLFGLNPNWGSHPQDHANHLHMFGLKILQWERHATCMVEQLGKQANIYGWINTGLGMERDQYPKHCIKLWKNEYHGTAIPALNKVLRKKIVPREALSIMWVYFSGSHLQQCFEGGRGYTTLESNARALTFGRCLKSVQLQQEGRTWDDVMEEVSPQLSEEGKQELTTKVICNYFDCLMPRMFMEDVLGTKAMNVFVRIFSKEGVEASMQKSLKTVTSSLTLVMPPDKQPEATFAALAALEAGLCHLVLKNHGAWLFEKVDGRRHWTPRAQNAGTCALHSVWWSHWVCKLSRVVQEEEKKATMYSKRPNYRSVFKQVLDSYTDLIHKQVCFFMEQAYDGKMQFRVLLWSILRTPEPEGGWRTQFWEAAADRASSLWLLVAAERPEGSPLFKGDFHEKDETDRRGEWHNRFLESRESKYQLAIPLRFELEEAMINAVQMLDQLKWDMPREDVKMWSDRVDDIGKFSAFAFTTSDGAKDLLLEHIATVTVGRKFDLQLSNVFKINLLPVILRRMLARILSLCSGDGPAILTHPPEVSPVHPLALCSEHFDWLALDVLGCTVPYMLSKESSVATSWEKQLQTHLPITAQIPASISGWVSAEAIARRSVGYEASEIPLTKNEVNYAVLAWLALQLEEPGAIEHKEGTMFANDGPGNRPITLCSQVASDGRAPRRAPHRFADIQLSRQTTDAPQATHTYQTISVLRSPAVETKVSGYTQAEVVAKEPYSTKVKRWEVGEAEVDCPFICDPSNWQDVHVRILYGKGNPKKVEQSNYLEVLMSSAEQERLLAIVVKAGLRKGDARHQSSRIMRTQLFDTRTGKVLTDVLQLYEGITSKRSAAVLTFVDGNPMLNPRLPITLDGVEWPPFQPDFYPGLAWLPLTDSKFATVEGSTTVCVHMGFPTPNDSSYMKSLGTDHDLGIYNSILQDWLMDELQVAQTAEEKEAEKLKKEKEEAKTTRPWDPKGVEPPALGKRTLKVRLNANLCFPVMPASTADRIFLRSIRTEAQCVITPFPSSSMDCLTSSLAGTHSGSAEPDDLSSRIQDLRKPPTAAFTEKYFVMPQNDFGLLPCDEFLNAHNPEQFPASRAALAKAVTTTLDKAMVQGIRAEASGPLPLSDKDMSRLRYNSVRTRWKPAFMSSTATQQRILLTLRQELNAEIQQCRRFTPSISTLAQVRARKPEGIQSFTDWALQAYGPMMRLGKCLTTLSQVQKLIQEAEGGGIKDPYSAMNLQRGAMDEGYRTRFEGLKMRNAAEFLFEIIFGHNVTTVQWDLVDAMQSREEKEGRVWQLMMGQGKTSVITPLVAFQQWLAFSNKKNSMKSSYPAHVFCPDHLVEATMRGMDMVTYMYPDFAAQIFSNKAAQMVSVVSHTDVFSGGAWSTNVGCTMPAIVKNKMEWSEVKNCVLLIDELDECMTPSHADFDLVLSKREWLSTGEMLLMLACILHTHTEDPLDGAGTPPSGRSKSAHFEARWFEILDTIWDVLKGAEVDPEDETARRVVWDGQVVLRWSQRFQHFLKKLLGMSQHMQYRVHYGPRSAELRQTMNTTNMSRGIVPYMRSDTPMDDSEFSTPALNILLWAVRFCNYDTQFKETTEFVLGEEEAGVPSPVLGLPRDIVVGLSRGKVLREQFLSALEGTLRTIPDSAVPAPSWVSVWRDNNSSHQDRMEAVENETRPVGASPAMISLQKAAVLAALIEATDPEMNQATNEMKHTHMWGTLMHWACHRPGETLQIGYSGTLEVVDTQMLQKVRKECAQHGSERQQQNLQCLPQVLKRNAVANILPKLSLTGQLDGARAPMFLTKTVGVEYASGSGSSASSSQSMFVHSSFEAIVRSVVDHKYDALIDSTAFLKDYAPSFVAQTLCTSTKRPVMYLDSKDETNMWVWGKEGAENRKKVPPVHVPGCIMYFDQRHTVGTDIARQPGRLHGLLLLGHKTTVAQASQAAARLRKLAQGHLVDLCWTSIAMPSVQSARGIWNSLKANEQRAITGSAQLTSYVHQLQLSCLNEVVPIGDIVPTQARDMEHSRIWLPETFHVMNQQFEPLLRQWWDRSSMRSMQAQTITEEAFMRHVADMARDPAYDLDNFIMFITGLSVMGDSHPSTQVSVSVSQKEKSQAQQMATGLHIDRTPLIGQTVNAVSCPPPPERAFSGQNKMLCAEAKLYNGMYRVGMWRPDQSQWRDCHHRFAIPVSHDMFIMLHSPQSAMYFMSLGCVNVLQGGRAHGQSMVFDSSWRKGHNINMQPLMPLISMDDLDYKAAAAASSQSMRSAVNPFVDATFFEPSCPESRLGGGELTMSAAEELEQRNKGILAWMAACDMGDMYLPTIDWYTRPLTPYYYCSPWTTHNRPFFKRSSNFTTGSKKIWENLHKEWVWRGAGLAGEQPKYGSDSSEEGEEEVFTRRRTRFRALIQSMQPPPQETVFSGPDFDKWVKESTPKYVNAVWGGAGTYPPARLVELLDEQESVNPMSEEAGELKDIALVNDGGRARLCNGRWSVLVPDALQPAFSGAKFWQRDFSQPKFELTDEEVDAVLQSGVYCTKEGQLAVDPEVCDTPEKLEEGAKLLHRACRSMGAEVFWNVHEDVLHVNDSIPSYRRARYGEMPLHRSTEGLKIYYWHEKPRSQSVPSLSTMEGIPSLNTACTGINQAEWTQGQACMPAYFATETVWRSDKPARDDEDDEPQVPAIVMWRIGQSPPGGKVRYVGQVVIKESDHKYGKKIMKDKTFLQKACKEPKESLADIIMGFTTAPAELDGLEADMWGEAAMMWLAVHSILDVESMLDSEVCKVVQDFEKTLLEKCAGIGVAAWLPWLQAYYEHMLRIVA